MSNSPINETFLIAKALTEVLGEKVEEQLTNVLSDIGKFDAETRQRLQEFAQEVKARAERKKEEPSGSVGGKIVNIDIEVDPQEILDELRHEIARLKAELTNYRRKDD